MIQQKKKRVTNGKTKKQIRGLHESSKNVSRTKNSVGTQTSLSNLKYNEIAKILYKAPEESLLNKNTNLVDRISNLKGYSKSVEYADSIFSQNKTPISPDLIDIKTYAKTKKKSYDSSKDISSNNIDMQRQMAENSCNTETFSYIDMPQNQCLIKAKEEHNTSCFNRNDDQSFEFSDSLNSIDGEIKENKCKRSSKNIVSRQLGSKTKTKATHKNALDSSTNKYTRKGDNTSRKLISNSAILTKEENSNKINQNQKPDYLPLTNTSEKEISTTNSEESPPSAGYTPDKNKKTTNCNKDSHHQITNKFFTYSPSNINRLDMVNKFHEKALKKFNLDYHNAKKLKDGTGYVITRPPKIFDEEYYEISKDNTTTTTGVEILKGSDNFQLIKCNDVQQPNTEQKVCFSINKTSEPFYIYDSHMNAVPPNSVLGQGQKMIICSNSNKDVSQILAAVESISSPATNIQNLDTTTKHSQHFKNNHSSNDSRSLGNSELL
ncbi:hypothetical protein CEXT_401791 [Caerostris extrusa]|uniref:Uncharacterized protein n=1 Tax=Caerostris extrusa TaxID=172846 RepID=A0AAV4NUL7_CAEEX|nr:hypothetical protein CEXT_401791 [Caerostris extrusa]